MTGLGGLFAVVVGGNDGDSGGATTATYSPRFVWRRIGVEINTREYWRC